MSGVRVERDGAVLRITLARPEVRNALDAGVIEALTAAFTTAGDARAVVLSGDGPTFCSGADFGWIRAAATAPVDDSLGQADALRRLLESVEACPAPVIALVQGHAVGAGAALVTCSDIAIAHRDAAFAFSEVKLGIVPSAISPFAIARIGAGMARRYLVTGERFDAETACRIGLVHEVADDLGAACDAAVAELVDAAPEAVRATKRLLLDRP